MKQSNLKWVKVNPFKDWGNCFRSVFDKQTGVSDGHTRLSMVGGQTMILRIVIKCTLHDKLITSVMLCYYQAMLFNVYLLRLNTSIKQICLQSFIKNCRAIIITGLFDIKYRSRCYMVETLIPCSRWWYRGNSNILSCERYHWLFIGYN